MKQNKNQYFGPGDDEEDGNDRGGTGHGDISASDADPGL